MHLLYEFRAFKKSRNLHYKNSIDKHKYSLLVNLPVVAIDTAYFPFCAYDYFAEENGRTPIVLVNEKTQLIYGLSTLTAVIKKKKSRLPCFIIDLSGLVKTKQSSFIFYELTLSQRIAIGLTLEFIIGNRQGQRTDRLTPCNEVDTDTDIETPTDSALLAQDFAKFCYIHKKETREQIAHLIGMGNRETYRQAKKSFLRGIPELRRAMDEERMSIYRTAQIADLPPDKQISALTSFLDARKKRGTMKC